MITRRSVRIKKYAKNIGSNWITKISRLGKSISQKIIFHILNGSQEKLLYLLSDFIFHRLTTFWDKKKNTLHNNFFYPSILSNF